MSALLVVSSLLAACTDADDAEPNAEPTASLQMALPDSTDCFVARDPDPLDRFAAKCDSAIGDTVPAFDCDAGQEVIEGHDSGTYPNMLCDRPNVLNSRCDPGSRFQVLPSQNPDVYMVAHCRKSGHLNTMNPGAGYADIAVIQYNKKNGATCFYQALQLSTDPPLPAQAPAPSSGDTNFWYTPSDTAGIQCVRCHDTGPFVRSPYLARLDSICNGGPCTPNVLPGTGPTAGGGWNKTLPYKFVGNEFQKWKAYSVSTPGICKTCHRMGISSVNGTFAPQMSGTSLSMGPIATATSQQGKHPHSSDAPIWMIPDYPGSNYPLYDANHEQQALAFRDCAAAIANHMNNGGPVPPSNCNWTKFAQGNTCTGASITGTINGGTQADPGDDKIDVTIPVGICNEPNDCPPGFLYWTSIHGPLWQKEGVQAPSGGDAADPSYRGSFLSIFVQDNVWQVRSFADTTGLNVPTLKAPPGGTYEGIHFQDIQGVPDPQACTGGGFFVVANADGSNNFESRPLGAAGQFVSVLSGFVGNVAKYYGDEIDFLRVYEPAGDALLERAHFLPRPAPFATGGLRGEAWKHGCQGWTPIYHAQHVRVFSDDLLVAYPQSETVRCFITGITGDWTTTQDNGWVQPYAQIYKDPGTSDMRMRVFPEGSVSAYASCLRIN